MSKVLQLVKVCRMSQTKKSSNSAEGEGRVPSDRSWSGLKMRSEEEIKDELEASLRYAYYRWESVIRRELPMVSVTDLQQCFLAGVLWARLNTEEGDNDTDTPMAKGSD